MIEFPVLVHAARRMTPLLLLASVWMLLRGHHEPGGGFVGGLLAAAALTLIAVVSGVREARRLLRVDPGVLTAVGLAVALGSGLVGLLAGGVLLEGRWWGVLGTPLVFDVGVYFVVIGVVAQVLWTLLDEEEGAPC